MAWIFKTMIIPVAQADKARELAATLAGSAGANMWITPLYTQGVAEATHYISAGLIDSEYAALLTDSEMLFSACKNAHIDYSLEQIELILKFADIFDDDPFLAMDRLGLSLNPAQTEFQL